MVLEAIAIVLAAPNAALAAIELAERWRSGRSHARPPRRCCPYARHVREVNDRVADARYLWRAGRRDGALLMALIAVAVRARHEFAPPTRDREAFEAFIRLRLQPRISVEFRGRQEPIEHILYKWMRCELVHEGGLPFDIQLDHNGGREALVVRAGGAPAYTVLLSTSWFDQLLLWATS